MTNEVLVLSMLLALGIIYVFTFYRVQYFFFRKFNIADANNAVLIIFISSLISSSINMVHIADIAADAFRYFIGTGSYLKGFLYCLAFFSATWIFSIVLFQVSFVIVGIMTRENEADELIKNNTFLALVHSVILLTLAFIISPALVKIAAGFILYPQMPF